jgi:hypothetical protein
MSVLKLSTKTNGLILLMGPHPASRQILFCPLAELRRSIRKLMHRMQILINVLGLSCIHNLINIRKSLVKGNYNCSVRKYGGEYFSRKETSSNKLNGWFLCKLILNSHYQFIVHETQLSPILESYNRPNG